MTERNNYPVFEESVLSVARISHDYGIDLHVEPSVTYFGGIGRELACVTPNGDYFYLVYLPESELNSGETDFSKTDADVVVFSMPIVALIADFPGGSDRQAIRAFEQFVHGKVSQIGSALAQFELDGLYTCVHEIEGGLAIHLDGDWTNVVDFGPVTQTVSRAIASYSSIKEITDYVLSSQED